MRKSLHDNAQRKVNRRAKPDSKCVILEKGSQDRGNSSESIRYDEWDLLRSLAQDSSVGSGTYRATKESELTGKLSRIENGANGLRTGKSRARRSLNPSLYRENGNQQGKPSDRLRFNSRSQGVATLTCVYCGRLPGKGCRCLIEYPSRKCSTHHTSLVYMASPVYAGNGTDDNPHRITHYFDFLFCPMRGCGYSRPLKNPSGEGRGTNRKTAFRRIRSLTELLPAAKTQRYHGCSDSIYEGEIFPITDDDIPF